MPTAPATITFHHADPDRAATILAALRIHGFRLEYHEAVTAPLHLFTQYRVRDASTMICTQLGTLIRRLDHSAVFTISQELTGEFVGQKLISDPDLGEHVCPIDEQGAELIAADTLRHTITAAREASTAGGAPADAFTALDRLTGGPWQRQIALLRAMAGTHLTALTTHQP